MKATFEIGFQNEKEAEDACNVVKAQIGNNATLHVLHKKGEKTVLYIVEANSFSPLRARSTSLLRDIKIMKTVFEKNKQKV